ncbi:hypothetical protein OWR29_12830 [Actinoplanes sp. Pm04-4]|uniref:Uncharacterized protein n=1 Tax=Paractinoplanes pyxinae TaxID=2997416 RepID=A0ABT4AXE1_9ACTN|nr:hypothetical protein [Actinoplanes pyxinae]MCY1138886.1 hypothetical protein [Actinoplanes pyxinae]
MTTVPRAGASARVPHPRGLRRFVGRAPVPSAPEVDPVERRWERTIAIAIALITVSSALVTYLALSQESKAAAADQRAVAETVMQQQQETDATARTQASGGLAARYRRMAAEAEAQAAVDPERARMTWAVANSFLLQSNIGGFVGEGTASDRFDYDNYRLMALHSFDGFGLAAGKAEQTAALADRHRAHGQRLTLCAVAMLAIVLVLTVARQARRRLRILLFSGAAAGFGGALLAAAWSFA